MDTLFPNHPAFVHFPLALLCVAFLFELLALITRKPLFADVARIALYLGTLGAIVAVATGLWGEPLTEGKPDAIEGMSESHKSLSLVVGGLAVLLSAWRLFVPRSLTAWRRGVYVIALGSTVALVLYTAHLGGSLVYDHGVGVTIGKRTFGSKGLPAESLQPRSEEEERRGEDDKDRDKGEADKR
jgi:uncharacterized membrane protein